MIMIVSVCHTVCIIFELTSWMQLWVLLRQTIQLTPLTGKVVFLIVLSQLLPSASGQTLLSYVLCSPFFCFFLTVSSQILVIKCLWQELLHALQSVSLKDHLIRYKNMVMIRQTRSLSKLQKVRFYFYCLSTGVVQNREALEELMTVCFPLKR